MTRNQARDMEEQSGQAARQTGLRGVLWYFSWAILVYLVWLDLLSLAGGVPFSGSKLLRLAGLCALLAWTAERALSTTRLNLRWRYRLALVSGASLPVFFWAFRLLGQFLGPVPASFSTGAFSFVQLLLLELIASGLGAFAGCLANTTVHDGLWENNSPPAERIQQEVHQWHVQRIGFPAPGPLAKRGFDILLALFGFVLSAPVWLLCAFVLWIEDPGPLFFVKNSVGKGGLNFRQFKFRTMLRGAEEHTGPVLSQQGDGRVLAFGRLLRKTALDELPQLINILIGEMSFVGPRPQRTVLVHGYLQSMPEYAERHRVLPGLAGLAQVAGDYYLTPRRKLRYDRIYIRHLSLGFDLKLLFLAFIIAFWFRWQPGWDGRLPRKWLR